MTGSEGSPDATDDTGSSRSGSLWTVLAPAAALVLGLVLGGVLVGVTTGDDEGGPSAEATSGATDATGESSVSASPGDTIIVVPEECLEAAQTVEEAADLADRSAEAIRDLRADELRSLLRRLEDLDQQARAQAEACQEVETTSASP